VPFRLLGRIVSISMACLALPTLALPQSLPQSVLILDQSDRDSAWYRDFSASFRETLHAKAADRVSIYAEHLDLSRFRGPQQDEVLRRYLRGKFVDTPIGVVVVQGSSALEFMLRSRAELWPKVPVVFAGVDEAAVARLQIPPDVTGVSYELSFRDAVASARMLVPSLKRIALVGDPFERQAVRGHFKQEIPIYAAGLEIIDLMNLPMAELRQRVAVLPDDTAIVYTAINVDGAGAAYQPNEALAAFADAANRPIVIDAETSMGYGGTGGLILGPGPVAEDAAQRVLLILDGEDTSRLPIFKGSFARPIFDWRQLDRFGISERNLPPGSDIRFRPVGMWEQYRWQMIAIAAALLLQAVIITWLLLERDRRRRAELASRSHMLEAIHLNRTAAAGALSASIAHELNQPLGTILSNAEAGELLLAANPPDIGQLKDILGDIREADQRAADIIDHLRKLLKRRSETELQEFDVNEAVAGAVHILSPEAAKRRVELSTNGIQGSLPVRADKVQMQQVILNLAMNGMDAMSDAAPATRRMSIQTALTNASEVEVSVADSGTGIPSEKLGRVFDTFYTTKEQGTGLGLSIARTIVETHGGKIWAENRSGGGAVFRFTLPLAETRAA